MEKDGKRYPFVQWCFEGFHPVALGGAERATAQGAGSKKLY